MRVVCRVRSTHLLLPPLHGKFSPTSLQAAVAPDVNMTTYSFSLARKCDRMALLACAIASVLRTDDGLRLCGFPMAPLLS